MVSFRISYSEDKGKLPVIDVTQIPKSMGIDVDKWMHYMNALGVVFVNPYEGWNIPGKKVVNHHHTINGLLLMLVWLILLILISDY